MQKTMTSISSIFNRLFITVLVIGACVPVPTHAQNATSLSVTPPLFQLSAEPGQIWQSSIKVINTNDFPLTVYAQPVNFEAQGENGRGRFLPILEQETDGQTLAEWISVSEAPIIIDPESSKEVPFVVNLPDEVPPGGHFAAIFIGTRPPEETESMAVRTSQVVSSLFFLTVSGDVIERGSIREFSVENSFTEVPTGRFVLRFQNEGNVHVRPRGNITIYNMWGKERGVIPINQQGNFGNVLPSSVRKFEFSWAGEPTLADIGRYTAEVVLGYGSNNEWRTLTRTVHFWVIPVKLALVAFGIILSLILLVRWAIKSYIRHMLRMAGIDPEERQQERAAGAVVMTKKLKNKTANARVISDSTPTSSFGGLLVFVNRYLYFFIGIPSGIALLAIMFWYLSGALAPERGFEATVTQGDSAIEVNSETLRRDELPTEHTDIPDLTAQPYAINIINVSGESGKGAEVSLVLEEAGYRIDDIDIELGRRQANTVIVAPEERTVDAQALSDLLGNALVSFSASLASTTNTLSTINIFVGQD